MTDPACEPWKWNQLMSVVASIVDVLTAQPGIGRRKLRAGVRSLRGKCSDADTDAALLILGRGVQIHIGQRWDHHYTLDLEHAPAKVRAYLDSRAT